MAEKEKRSLQDIFNSIEDPRHDKGKKHKLFDILVIAFCAILSGAEGFTDFETFGKSKKDFFQRFLSLENGIPSHDTFGKVFALLNTSILQHCFLEWLEDIRNVFKNEGIAIDGKKLRGSKSKKRKNSAVTMLSAWAKKSGLVIGQMKIEEGSNEISSIPELLDLLEIKGCIVTIDAIGCQKEIVKKIIKKGGDYVIPVKGNQPKLEAQIKNFFLEASETNFSGCGLKSNKTKDKKHGRIEEREYWVTENLEWLENKEEWSGLKSVIMVYRKRQEGEKSSEECFYYISSLEGNPRKIGKHIREHWSIENKLHWKMDIAFREDDCKIREENAAANVSVLRHFALNLLKDKNLEKKSSLRTKIKRCGWDENFLLNVLAL